MVNGGWLNGGEFKGGCGNAGVVVRDSTPNEFDFCCTLGTGGLNEFVFGGGPNELGSCGLLLLGFGGRGWNRPGGTPIAGCESPG